MTLGELRVIIKDMPDDLPVVYNYDTGHSYPNIRYAYRRIPDNGYGNAKEDVLVLDEDSEQEARRRLE